MRRPVLFVAENVTLAQVVRLVTLARALDPARYDVHFASSGFDELVFAGTKFTRWPITTIGRGFVERAVAQGRRIYDRPTLRRYVAEELELFERIRPALVVGDFRQSLTVSAPLAGVPHANLINAYWSPFAVRETFPLPDHPMVRLLGEGTAARYFPRAMPWVFDHFARPVNQLRREHGLPPVGSLPEVLVAGDYTLYPDVPELVPSRDLPSNHLYLGPVQWSPELPLPSWWSSPSERHRTIYVTLGSSGNLDVLPTVLEALRGLNFRVLLSTAGRAQPAELASNIQVADYLPGELAARRSALVISNGGSTTGYQALGEGVPVIGIPFNLDQYLSMQAVERAGAGIALRAGSLTASELRAAIALVLADQSYTERASELARVFGRYDAASRFRRFVQAVTDPAEATRLAV